MLTCKLCEKPAKSVIITYEPPVNNMKNPEISIDNVACLGHEIRCWYNKTYALEDGREAAIFPLIPSIIDYIPDSYPKIKEELRRIVELSSSDRSIQHYKTKQE
ncbi:MAG: hypothetical protein IB618_01095 [Candidatus Pacearchaeota archaeon]|nr:MAG: hypothetical protein IB618_01095 [Candidatus Pacearchaeota archaeon]